MTVIEGRQVTLSRMLSRSHDGGNAALANGRYVEWLSAQYD